MLKFVGRSAGALALAAVYFCSSPARAQDAMLTELYGSGAHSFFAGDYYRAEESLTGAINGGSKDPRAYYFRAMTLMRMGREDEAKSDLKKGAALESADVNQFYPVGKSLERIQGSSRLTLERYRSLARAEAHGRQEKRDAARYEKLRRAEANVLRAPDFDTRAGCPTGRRSSGSRRTARQTCSSADCRRHR